MAARSDHGQRLPDGTPFFGVLGDVFLCNDGTLIQCHLCGRFFRRLASGHIQRAHEMEPDDYRRVFELRHMQPLQALDLSAQQASEMRRRIRTDESLRRGMAQAHEMARRGELVEYSRARAGQPMRLQRRELALESGAEGGRRRAASFRRAREERARALGFRSLQAYLEQRYLRDGALVDDLAAEIGAAPEAVIGDMERFGIARLTLRERAARARRAGREAPGGARGPTRPGSRAWVRNARRLPAGPLPPPELAHRRRRG